MTDNKIVYIIGFMGSGKSTAGKKLAATMGWSFIDLDKKVEERIGKTIPQVFSEFGEDYFRKIETEVLRSMRYQKKAIISTGGGAPCHSENMEFMLDTGLTVYLRLTPVQLRNRLSAAKGERPLIKNLGSEDLLSFIENKLHVREECYSRAEIQIDGFEIDYNLLNSLINKSLNI